MNEATAALDRPRPVPTARPTSQGFAARIAAQVGVPIMLAGESEWYEAQLARIAHGQSTDPGLSHLRMSLGFIAGEAWRGLTSGPRRRRIARTWRSTSPCHADTPGGQALGRCRARSRDGDPPVAVRMVTSRAPRARTSVCDGVKPSAVAAGRGSVAAAPRSSRR